MESVIPGDPGTAPHRGRLNRAIKESLRDLGTQVPQRLLDRAVQPSVTRRRTRISRSYRFHMI